MLLNTPSELNNQVVAATLTDRGAEHAVVIDLTRIMDATQPGQETLLHADINGPTVSGVNPYTGLQDTVTNITDLLLVNTGGNSINFEDDSGVTTTVAFS